jgi:hypothetical protein
MPSSTVLDMEDSKFNELLRKKWKRDKRIYRAKKKLILDAKSKTQNNRGETT